MYGLLMLSFFQCWIVIVAFINAGSLLRKALAQILAKGYDQVHRKAGREVHCIGVEFSRAKRAIVGWEMG